LLVIIEDKIIKYGCSRRRPDLLLDIEYDLYKFYVYNISRFYIENQRNIWFLSYNTLISFINKTFEDSHSIKKTYDSFEAFFKDFSLRGDRDKHNRIAGYPCLRDGSHTWQVPQGTPPLYRGTIFIAEVTHLLDLIAFDGYKNLLKSISIAIGTSSECFMR
jgi:hypothetical protein